MMTSFLTLNQIVTVVCSLIIISLMLIGMGITHVITKKKEAKKLKTPPSSNKKNIPPYK